VNSYAELFVSYRRDVSEKARQYASGLMQAGSRKNIYAISEVVPDTDDRNLQQFITHSKTDAALIIDESGFAKQGKMSVGAMLSDATKRASRAAKGSLRPKTNWLWKSLRRLVATECALAGLGPMRAMAVVRTFYLLWLMQAKPVH
jgi:SRSO17 transposase